MAAEFCIFYQGLYNPSHSSVADPPTTALSTIYSYIVSSCMPSLPSELRKELEEPVTVEELGVALANSKPKKSPHLVSALNSLTDGQSMPIDTLRAYLSLIPKEKKDLSQCGSHRLIALLNTDLRLFAKNLANKLLLHIPHLIHQDQAGFVPLREPRENTVRVVNMIHVARTASHPLILLSTDVEKAFDRVSWQFMGATLEHIGLESSMRSWISSLYSQPSAAVKVNETRLDFLMIMNGMRQG